MATAKTTTDKLAFRFLVLALIASAALNVIHVVWQQEVDRDSHDYVHVHVHTGFRDAPENTKRKGKAKNEGSGAIATPETNVHDSAKESAVRIPNPEKKNRLQKQPEARAPAQNYDNGDDENDHGDAPKSATRHEETKTKTDTDTDTSIRSWGCGLTETPLIFVHTGKSGGGKIRARLAAGAQNYTRKDWKSQFADDHYYPIASASDSSNANSSTNASVRRGKFCTSFYPHYVSNPHIETPLDTKYYEKTMHCNATTPLGIAVACHHPQDGYRGGGIVFRHYKNQLCNMCDDDYYLDAEYYFGGSKKRNATAFVNRQIEVASEEHTTVRTFPNANEIPRLDEAVFDPSKDPPPGTTCDIVYAAHNSLGSELNWLPPRYLKEHWWDNSKYGTRSRANNNGNDNDNDKRGNSNSNSEPLERYWERLLDDRHRRRKKLERRARGKDTETKAKALTMKSTLNYDLDLESDTFLDNNNNNNINNNDHRWCPKGYGGTRKIKNHHRPENTLQYNLAYPTCGLALAKEADDAFLDAFFRDPHKSKNYSPFYASMPLHRITVLRDPWSWIISKFFWHHLASSKLQCHQVEVPATAKGGTKVPLDPITGHELGWCQTYSLMFLFKLCGNDCLVRYENGMMALEEIEAQVASNLRQAFSVVGLLEEEASFYDMVTDRIQYIDAGLNLHERGNEHMTEKNAENLRCKKLFGSDEEFRESVRQKVPAFAALERIYILGIEVNAFQKEELKQCKLAKGEQPTNNTYAV